MKRLTKTGLRAGLVAAGLAAPVYAQIPIQHETQVLRSPPGAENLAFGAAVDIDGDTAVIGAPGLRNSDNLLGAVYVYTRENGVWELQQRLEPAGAPTLRECGDEVAISGDTLIFNCNNHLSNNTLPRTYFFERRDGVWTESASFAPPPFRYPGDTEDHDVLGLMDVDIDGDIAVIGDISLPNFTPGRAYIYLRDPEHGWRRYWEPERQWSWPYDLYGISISVDNGTVVIGASDTLIDSTEEKGAIHIFEAEPGNIKNWPGYTAFRQTGAADTGFGREVAVDGDMVVVGRAVSNGRRGQVIAYQRTGAGWELHSTFVPSDVKWQPGTGARFGDAVAMDGGILAVASLDGNDISKHTIYILRLADDGAQWLEEHKLFPQDNTGPELGRAMALSSGTVIAAGSGYESNEEERLVYMFELPGLAPPPVDETGPVVQSQRLILSDIEDLFSPRAVIDDRGTGGSAIASATFTLADYDSITAPLPTQAEDGAFDEAIETVAPVDYSLRPPPGLYDFCVTGTDTAGHASDQGCSMVAVFTRDAGPLTGGGWFRSPEGAYLENNQVAGKMKFRFQAVYDQDSTPRPTGRVTFELPAADLLFESEVVANGLATYVAAGPRAYLFGSGKINGKGYYYFQLSAVDSGRGPGRGRDRIRLRIWDKNNDATLVYDNEPDALSVEDPTTTLGGGQVKIRGSRHGAD